MVKTKSAKRFTEPELFRVAIFPFCWITSSTSSTVRLPGHQHRAAALLWRVAIQPPNPSVRFGISLKSFCGHNPRNASELIWLKKLSPRVVLPAPNICAAKANSQSPEILHRPIQQHQDSIDIFAQQLEEFILSIHKRALHQEVGR